MWCFIANSYGSSLQVCIASVGSKLVGSLKLSAVIMLLGFENKRLSSVLLPTFSSLTFFFFFPHVGCERHEVSEFPVWNYPYFLPTYLIYTLTHSWDSGVIPSTCALGSERHCPSCWTKHCSTDEELDISQILFIGSILSLRNLLLFYFCLSA